MVPLIRFRSQPPAQGFSLPEMMILVVTVLVLAGVVGPTFSNLLRQQRLRSSGWALAASINAARGAALRSNASCQIAITGTSVAPTTTPAGNCGTASLPASDLSQESQGMPLTVSGDTTFSFSAGGMLAGTTAQQIVYIATSGFTPRVCVRVERPSALVRVGLAADGGTSCTYTD
ncbi:MAG: hypothetical protein VKI63_06905 [Cyanobium sp.]|nr:hypothetical protein [Cyanobium sp.]